MGNVQSPRRSPWYVEKDNAPYGVYETCEQIDSLLDQGTSSPRDSIQTLDNSGNLSSAPPLLPREKMGTDHLLVELDT
jgi:hypothetical protein